MLIKPCGFSCYLTPHVIRKSFLPSQCCHVLFTDKEVEEVFSYLKSDEPHKTGHWHAINSLLFPLSSHCWMSPRICNGMGPNYMAADVRGAAAGCQGCGIWSVCHSQLADGLYAHPRLHTPCGHVRPVRALPVIHSGVCRLPAVQRRLSPRDSRPLAGGDRELFQDWPDVHHQTERIHCSDPLRLWRRATKYD